MAFAVQDFHDLSRLLDEHPEWQAELRRRVLTDELLELPALVRRIAEGQARTDGQLATLTARVGSLAGHLDTLTVRVDSIAERLDALTARVDALVVQVQALTVAMGDLQATVQTQGARLDAAIGELVEARYERRAGAYFSHLARRVRVLDRSTLADLLEDAVEEGRIAKGDRRDVMHADLVLTGRRREDGADLYLVAEVSVGIGVDDVRRAADRAAVMARLGRPAVAVVAGERIDPEPAEMAVARGVRQVINGHADVVGESA